MEISSPIFARLAPIAEELGYPHDWRLAHTPAEDLLPRPSLDQIPFPIISDAPKTIFKKYTAHDDFENQPLHGTFVLDAQGRILWSDISADPFMEIDFLIKESQRLLALHKS